MPPHVGRGGWTWYTGSAGSMYRTGLEFILGFYIEGATLRIDPCVPRTWRDFEIVFFHRSTRYEIFVNNPDGVCRGINYVQLDDETLPEGLARVPLVDNGATHRIKVVLG